MDVGNENSKKVKRDKKQLTRYYRYPSCKRDYLCKLLLELLSIYELLLPNYRTDNEVLLAYPTLPCVYQKKQEEVLLLKLVHYNTLINRVHRAERKGRVYVSEEEDVLAALTLLEELVVLSKKPVEEDRDYFILRLIKEHIGTCSKFKTRDLYRHLGISQKRLQASLNRLTRSEKVKRVSGNRYRGYVYELV